MVELAKVWQNSEYMENSIGIALETMFRDIEKKGSEAVVDVEDVLESGLNEIILYMFCKPSKTY